MGDIFVVAVPGTFVNNALTEARNERGESTETKELNVKDREPLIGIPCTRHQLNRLKGMPECRGDFEAFERGPRGRMKKIYPPRERKKKRTLKQMCEQGWIRLGMDLPPRNPRLGRPPVK